MAYIPPHKRHSKDSKSPSPIPERLVPQLTRQSNLKSSNHDLVKSGDILYAHNAIYRWFVVGLAADSQAPPSLHLEPISVESFEQRLGKKPLVLVRRNPSKETDVEGATISSTPSQSVAVNVWPDLLSSFEVVRNKMETQDLDEGKPAMVARFGTILFHGTPSMRSESVRTYQVAETTLRQMNRTFYTNTSSSYMENIVNGVVPKIGIVHEEEKDTYYIKLSDSTQPKSAVICKCRIDEDKKLELYKHQGTAPVKRYLGQNMTISLGEVEGNAIRQMVMDISCIDKNLDLRLALCTKKILTALTDDEVHSIKNIINSAILDSEVKGGLRWPLGKACSGDRYAVIGVWHAISKKYKSPSFRLKVRHVNRFDFRTSIGESTMEVVLKLKGIVSCLQGGKVETDSIFNVFKENLRLIWDHFLCYEHDFA